MRTTTVMSIAVIEDGDLPEKVRVSFEADRVYHGTRLVFQAEGQSVAVLFVGCTPAQVATLVAGAACREHNLLAGQQERAT